ncbi:MAG: alpha/beta hydrolase family protein [Planctomycetota bacterium]
MARDTAEWRARPADIRFVIDQASRWNRSDTDLRGRIDLERVGVLGHSYGAYTALAAAGARVQVAGVSSDFSDPRVDAMVALSPSGPGGWGWFSETSYQSVDVPALLVTGSQDTMTDWQSGSWRKQAFDLMSPGPRYCLWLEGATHLDFADLPLASQRAATVHRIVETMTALFFEAHLKQDPVARKALQNAARAAALAGPAIPELQWYTKGG